MKSYFYYLERDFDKNPESINNLGTAYDYYSIMHFKWNAFAIDRKQPTIKIRNDNINSRILGTSESLSSTDIERINRFYLCPGYGKLRFYVY